MGDGGAMCAVIAYPLLQERYSIAPELRLPSGLPQLGT